MNKNGVHKSCVHKTFLAPNLFVDDNFERELVHECISPSDAFILVQSRVVSRRTMDLTGKRSDRQLSRAIKLTKTYDSPSLANQLVHVCMKLEPQHLSNWGFREPRHASGLIVSPKSAIDEKKHVYGWVLGVVQ